MIIVHCAVVEDVLAIWGETPEGHATADVLQGALALRGERRTVTALLPAAKGRPAPSSPLVGEVPKKTRLAPFEVETIIIDTAAAIDSLSNAVGKRLLGPGVVVGADLAFFATAMRAAATLVARGHVLPSLEQGKARWILAPMAGEREQIASLVRAIPPVSLAFTQIAPHAAVDNFLSSVTDHLMRSTHARPRTGRSLHDRWLSALFSEDGVVEATPAEIQQLRITIVEWRRSVHEQAASEVRLAFRLEEPDAEEEPWIIRFLIQGIVDPSLIVPIEDAFESKKLFKKQREALHPGVARPR